MQSEQLFIDGEKIKNRHKYLLDQGYTNNDKQDEILNILGGIEQIFVFYHQYSNEITPIIRIYDELSLNEISQDEFLNSTNLSYPTYSFNRKETFIHKLVPFKSANKFIEIIYNVYIAIFISIIILFSTISTFIDYEIYPTNTILWNIFNIITLVILSIYFVSLMFSINTIALRVILRTFTFWFQLIYSLRLSICRMLYYWYVSPQDWIAWIITTMISIVWMFAVIDISCLDAMPMPVYVNICVGMFGSIFFSIIAIIYTLSEFTQKENDFHFNLFNMSLSLNLVASIAYTSRVLSIFLWRQSLTPLFQQNTSALMKKRYSIKFTHIAIQQTEQQQFIDNLGGIDEILKNYLNINMNNSILDESQLNEINNILQIKLTQNKGCKMCRFQIYSKYTTQKVYLYLSVYNTCLHTWFGRQLGSKIVYVLYSKTMSVLMVLSLIFSMYTVIINKNILEIEMLSFYLIYCTFMLLSMNKLSIKLTAQTFEFWLKILYCIRWWICRMIACSDGLESEYTYFTIALEQLVWLVAIIFASFMDGWSIKIKHKIIIGIFGSLFFSMKTFFNTLIAINTEESCKWYRTFHIFGYSFTFSLIKWMAESAKITALILWKQTISTIVWKREKSVMIKRPCKVKWQGPLTQRYYQYRDLLLYSEPELSQRRNSRKLQNTE